MTKYSPRHSTGRDHAARWLWTWALLFLLSNDLFANAGIFGGVGQDVRLERTEKIQMVSEKVDIYLGRAEQPVTGGEKWQALDKAYYTCRFELKNLTDREVTVPVGFPLVGENCALPRYDAKMADINQTDIIAKFSFIAGAANGTYPIKYVKTDAEKKFSHLFLWDMTFKPDETINLVVSYKMTGYFGLGMTVNDQKSYFEKDYDTTYFDYFLESITTIFPYVTSTGKSWYGTIEDATFTIHLGEYEKYLNKRGPFEIDSDYIHYEKLQQKPPFSALHRRLKPNGWIEEGEGNERKIVYHFTQFTPGAEITIQYSFLHIPKTLDDYRKIVEIIKNEYTDDREKIILRNKASVEIPDEWNESADRNIKDIFLEYYGIVTNNPSIKAFLNDQFWYPVDVPREINADLKRFLQSSP